MAQELVGKWQYVRGENLDAFLAALAMAQELVGKWQYVRGENLDAFLAAVGASGKTKSALASGMFGSIEYAKDGNTWLVRTFGDGRTKEKTFQPGVEYNDTNRRGELMKVLPTLEGNVLTFVQKLPNYELTTVQEVVSNELVSKLNSVADPLIYAIRLPDVWNGLKQCLCYRRQRSSRRNTREICTTPKTVSISSNTATEL